MELVSQLAGVLSLLLVVALAIAVIVRVARALHQRKAGRLREELGGPVMDAGAVQSKAFGFTPSAPVSFAPDDNPGAHNNDDGGPRTQRDQPPA